jgi:multiple sugar transport system permease protein
MASAMGMRRPIGYQHGPRVAIGSAIRWVVLVICAALFLIPFYLIVRGALSTEIGISSPTWQFFPTSLQWSNFSVLFNDPSVPMAHSMLVSLEIGVLQTAGQLLLAAMAGYGLARIPVRHSNVVFYLILGSLMIPGAVTFVPSFVLVSSLGWVSTLQGLIVPGLFNSFSAFIFRQHFLSFPQELEDAGRVDGLRYWGIFWRIVIPNSVSFIVAIGVIDFIATWNSFLWPLVIGQSDSSWTVQVAMSTFLTAQDINIPELLMAAGIAIVPIVAVFIFLQRYLVQGVAQSGIKG